MHHIVIVEDDKSISRELNILLKNALYQVTMIENFELAVTKIKKAAPDLVLLDINLPDGSGLDICKDLRQSSNVPIIFITGNDTIMDELTCLQQGGDDFITKPYQPSVLLARIQTVLKRTANPYETYRLNHRDVILDIAAAVIESGNQKENLTKNELKILHCLFINAGNFVSRNDLTDYLWDNQIFIDDNTLSVNMTRIRTKLAQIGIIDFIEMKRGLGYKLC